MSGYIPTERLCLTADGSRLVLEGDPEAASLFCIPGREIPLADAERFGLIAPETAKELDSPAEDKEADAVEDKALHIEPEVKRAPRPKKKS